MCSEASTVVRAVAADFFFDCGDVESPANGSIRNVNETSSRQQGDCCRLLKSESIARSR
jgi:hypothetical protein